MTLIQVKNLRKQNVWINPDHISSAVMWNDKVQVFMGTADQSHDISHEEWAYIDMKYTQTDAPAASNKHRDELLPILDEYAGCLRGQLCDQFSSEGQARLSRLRDEILDFASDAPAAQALPADVTSAYRQLRIDEIRFRNSSTVDEQRRELIDMLAAYIPVESEAK